VRVRAHADAMIDRLRGLVRADDSINLRFEGIAPAPHPQYGAQELRTVGLDGVEPGVWELTVTVTDLASGRRVERRTLIDIAEPQAMGDGL
jgi:hypothetical protein